MENEMVWQNWPVVKHRDYNWLAGAAQCFGAQSICNENAACIRFAPVPGGKDFAAAWGLEAGRSICFLLENQPTDEQEWATLLPAEQDVFCIAVKTGRPQLAWQQGMLLTGIRPVAVPRPFYLFCRTGKLLSAAPGMPQRLPLTQLKALGKQLEDGWLGVGYCSLSGEVLLLPRAK